MINFLKRKKANVKPIKDKYEECGIPPEAWGYIECGGYDPRKLCDDRIVARRIHKIVDDDTGEIRYLLEKESPYEVFKDRILTKQEALKVISKWKMETFFDKIDNAPLGNVSGIASWRCGHDVWQDDAYWEKQGS